MDTIGAKANNMGRASVKKSTTMTEARFQSAKSRTGLIIAPAALSAEAVGK
jgi:hypothetical protein